MRSGIQILAHRGAWAARPDMNTMTAFRRALEQGFGIETDIRDCSGRLVISHDAPKGDELDLDEFLRLYISFEDRPTLALNVKADGLAGALDTVLRRYGVTRYFVFDMSVPDTLSYLALGMPVFTRRSEYEARTDLDERASGVWMDWFGEGHVSVGAMQAELASGRPMAVVSPELHRRPHREAWEGWAEAFRSAVSGQVMLCTDLCAEAAGFFAAVR